MVSFIMYLDWNFIGTVDMSEETVELLSSFESRGYEFHRIVLYTLDPDAVDWFEQPCN